ncbi:hypothetical protein JCM11491_005111 [Sporobolomyces phaffii]
MKKSSTSTNLKPPGSTDTQRHQLRQRSPQGQRGRSRRTPAPTPPPTPLERIRASPWFWPGLVALGALVLALLYSAIRISSHTADHYPPAYPPSKPVLARAKKPRIGRAGAADSGRTTSSAPPSAHTVKAGEKEVDEAIRSALEQTWHLSEQDGRSSRSAATEDTVSEADLPLADGDTPTKRSLADLYQELDELGISAEDLNAVLNNAIGGNL